jgi:hypothetical protein
MYLILVKPGWFSKFLREVTNFNVYRFNENRNKPNRQIIMPSMTLPAIASSKTWKVFKSAMVPTKDKDYK